MTDQPDIELDLEKIKRLGEKRIDENYDFRAFLKQQNSKKVDEIVHRLNQEVSDQIDCTACGNCCMKLKPAVTDNDIERLAVRLNLPAKHVKKKHTEIQSGEQQFKNLPCSFLKDKKCSVYEDRPEMCRSYPHLHKSHFTSRLFQVIDNYSICPIVFNVYEKLKDELHFKG